ncbi:hypothetical protein C8R44DRAFT_894457 [Mycena epipterygia]|nr:hypothetical protein C8R44DRAFT_894457 [Mycena epipterygia]
MGLLCRHDRVLWLVNMHSAGEKQFNLVVLMETLFQHLPLDIVVGLLYDVACAFERSCCKWAFLSRFMDRLAFAVSVFHAFGHEWACQLLYHPRKRTGFGFTNGEGCERFWHSISHLIANLRISGYHNRLYTLDAQIEHADKASLFCLGQWISRWHVHSCNKRQEAKKVLTDCGKPIAVLREQWALQVATQTKPLPRRTKKRGEQAVNAVMLLRAAAKTRQAQVRELQEIYLEAVEADDPDAVMFQVQFNFVSEALTKLLEKLRQKEAALGVTENQALKTLATSQYICLRMNAHALKRRLRDRLHTRKFELGKLERSFRRLVNDQKLYSHTESAVKRREPTISKANSEYNKLCRQSSPWRNSASANPDVGLDEDDGQPGRAPPLWLADEKVRVGIKAMLEVDRCDEEDLRLRRERRALQVWFAEEWATVNLAIKQTDSNEDKYQLNLLCDNLVRLCATWQKHLPDFGVDERGLPPWGPTPVQLSSCVVDEHVTARGKDRHYHDDGSDEDEGDGHEEESGGEDEDFAMLDVLEMADVYRNVEVDEYNADFDATRQDHGTDSAGRAMPSDDTSNVFSFGPGAYLPLAPDFHMAPYHNLQTKTMRRLSSPLLPLAVFPSIQSCQGARNAKLRKAAEEVERATLNEQVWMLRDAAAVAPNDLMKFKEYRFKLSDYEDQFGKFIPDNENADWHTRKEAAFDALVVQRREVVFLSHHTHNSELHDYFGTVDVYEAEFGVTFDLDHGWSHTLKTKRKLLQCYDDLMDRADGNRQRASDIAGRD